MDGFGSVKAAGKEKSKQRLWKYVEQIQYLPHKEASFNLLQKMCNIFFAKNKGVSEAFPWKQNRKPFQQCNTICKITNSKRTRWLTSYIR